MGACGACERLTAALALFPTDVDIQVRGLHSIQNLACECKENERLLFSYGALERVVKALTDFPLDVEIQEFGIGAITNLTFHNDYREKLGALGVSQKIVSAMEAFLSDCDIQTCGAAAVANLSDGNASNTRTLLTAGVCTVLLKALARFRTDTDLQYQGCLAISNLCMHENARKALINAGAKERMKAALSTIALDGDIKSNARRALELLHKVGRVRKNKEETGERFSRRVWQNFKKRKVSSAV